MASRISTQSVSRRNVLKTIAAGAVSAPYMLTSSALGSSSTAPASERVTIGHIGAGNRGSALLDGFLNCGQGQSVAVSDAYRDRREATAARFGGKAYADFHELLARPDIDAVVIATPDHWHVLMAIAAMEAGKHVYVEKPLGICIEHDQLCRRAVGRTGKLFQYGTQQRSMPHCRLGCELVRSGRIGKIHRIEVVAPRGQQGGSTEQAPIPPTLDYNRWIGPAPMVDYTVDRCTASGSYFVYDYSIGFLAGWGAHPLDLMIWGCDADLSGPIVVEGTGEIDRNGLYDSVATWDMKIKLGEVPMSFKSGTGQCDRTRFIGSEGWIEVRRQGWDAEPKSLMTDNMNEDQFTLKRSLRHDQDFLESIKSGEQPISPISEAVRSDIISHLCDIAIRKERKITWDPKREVIVGDDDAAKMLKRPMREPWTL